jgi:hypothetical protein
VTLYCTLDFIEQTTGVGDMFDTISLSEMPRWRNW